MANLTTEQIGKVQFESAIVYMNFGVTSSQKLLGATRNGAEFIANMTIRDIDFDGAFGKTAGAQVIESQDAMIRCTFISLTNDNIKASLPGCRTSGTGTSEVIKNPVCGPIATASYQSNVTIFGKTIDGKYKKCMIKTALAENGLSIRMAAKSEAEQVTEFSAHYGASDTNGDLWEIADVESTSTGGVTGG